MPALDPSTMPHVQVYDLLVSAVQPRPIAFVSTINANGETNLAPFSFFMAGGASPPSLVYSPTLNKRGEKKDSLRFVEETREFVINTVTREMADGMNNTSYEYPYGHSEWEVSGFTKAESDVVKPARVLESPISFECKLFQIVYHGEGASAACYIIGEVVRMHVRDDLWDGQMIDANAFRPISRMGGPNYLDTESLELFSMARPSGVVQPSIEP